MKKEKKQPGDGEEHFFEERHHPEFILIEGSGEGENYSKREKEELPIAQAISIGAAFSLRMIALVASLIAFICHFVAMVGMLVSLLAVLITFGKSPQAKFIFQISRFWWHKTAAIVLGCCVGIFSPPFGLAIITTYFFMVGEQFNVALFEILGSGTTKRR